MKLLVTALAVLSATSAVAADVSIVFFSIELSFAMIANYHHRLQMGSPSL